MRICNCCFKQLEDSGPFGGMAPYFVVVLKTEKVSDDDDDNGEEATVKADFCKPCYTMFFDKYNAVLQEIRPCPHVPSLTPDQRRTLQVLLDEAVRDKRYITI